jgi:glycosyltransferase involved in cell wall biosynthesis
MNIITSILRKFKKDKNLNILTCPTHERMETYLSKTPDCTFWSLLHPSVKDWNLKYMPVPKNYNIIREIPDWLEIDIVLSQNRFGQFQLLSPIAKNFNIPLITIEHTFPVPSWDNNIRNQMRSMSGNIDCFITENSRAAWGWDENSGRVIRHGVDTEIFKPNNEIKQENVILSICNDFINRDGPCGYNIWKETIQGLPYKILGDTPGLSEPAKDINDLVVNYNTSSIFLNTTVYSPIPCVLLEAMSCGLPVVSTNTCEIPSVIEHGYNGFLGKDIKELKNYCEMLLNNEKLRKQIGNNARQTILKKYSLDNFTKTWRSIFEEAFYGKI